MGEIYMIYYIITAVFICFALLELYPVKRNLIFGVAALATVFLILFAAIRKHTGPDYGSYLILWNDAYATDPYDRSNEPFYFYLQYVLKFVFGLEFQSLIICFAVLSISLKFRAIQKWSPYFFVSLLLYFNISFLNQDFGQIRQGLATSITILSIQYVLEKRFRPFLLTVLLATSVHYTAIIFLLLYPLANIRLKLHAMMLIWLAAFGLSYFFTAFETLLAYVGSVLFPELNSKIFIYLTDEMYSKRLGFTPGMSLRFVNLAIMYLAVKPEEHNTERNLSRILVNSYFIGGCIFFLLNILAIFAARSSVYFTVIDFIALPLALQAISSRPIRYLVAFYIFLYVLYNIYLLINVTEGSMLVPYKTIFE
jgi:hypothetical protein